ncbi:auxin efflux carrier component 8 [Aristolochia californica]|uniref:auxin efflux carrier component 8 n=1 Tax=Aristolochia californica TaxID=171875 RepID=UPI0035DCFE9E
MISLADTYHVIEAMVPLYVIMILAYISVKWWKLFNPEQCSGINKFVANISIPLLSFRVISSNNPYHMILKLILADSLQKLLALSLLAIPVKFCSMGNLDWLITGFSVATLPNTLIMGIPLLNAMYGDEAAKLLSQIVVLQSVIWYSLLLFLFEFRDAEATSASQHDETTAELEAQEGAQTQQQERGKITTTCLKTKLTLLMVWRKLIKNPNTYVTLAGLCSATICFRYGLKLPEVIDKSVSILADGGLGMAMFSLGLFMASQSKIVACGSRMAVLSMAIRFLLGPSMMAASSYAAGLKARALDIAIVQAALPQGIVPFVFAREYNLHPEILSTGVIFGMLIALPITLIYYVLLSF